MELPPTEKLYRFFANKPDFFKKDTGRITSAAFKVDSDGISMDRANGRAERDCIAWIIRGRPAFGVLRLSVQQCIEQSCIAVADPVPGNCHHASVRAIGGAGSLTKGNSKRLVRQLAAASHIVKPPDM